jgi:hypothetical protein
MVKREKVPVSPRALIGRLNRALSHKYLAVRKARPGSRLEQEVGAYYLLDMNRNCIDRAGYDIDLESLAREYGVLRNYEALSDD